MKVAIIGGGASGIMCAVSLKKQNKMINVTVYEKLPRVLKKILVTGNGRCNITNVNSSPAFFRGDTELADCAFSKYPPKSNIELFASMGLLLREEAEGRVYPMSGQASSVVNVLLSQAQSLGVQIITDTEIKAIKKTEKGYILNNGIKADAVVVSAGGSAAPKQGTSGDSFKLLESLGLEIEKPAPALTGVVCENFPKSLKGIRNICEIKLEADGKILHKEKGEIQFNDYGISGIPVMQFSGLVSKSNSKNIFAIIDTLPDASEQELCEFLIKVKREYPQRTAEELACGILPKALGNQLLLMCEIKKDTDLVSISENKLKSFAQLLKKWKIKIKAVRDFEFAQVTAGGIRMSELNPETLETKKYKNLYVTGEAVNVYGLCGGHNLQWAWSSARVCADAILKELKSC